MQSANNNAPEVEQLAAVVQQAGPAAATQNHRTLHNPFSDARYLKKVLIDSGNRLDRAKQRVEDMMHWRRNFRPHQISLREVDLSMLAQTGITYLNGHDRQGRPIIYCKPANLDKLVCTHISHEVKVRMLILMLERALVQLGPDCSDQSFIIIIDLAGRMGVSVSDVQYMRQHLMNVLMECYAERLAYCFVLNPPFIFSTIWSLAKRFVDVTTLEKYHFLRAKHDQTRVLINYISPDQLEIEYGGTNPFEFCFEKVLEEDFEICSTIWGCPSELDSSQENIDRDFPLDDDNNNNNNNVNDYDDASSCMSLSSIST